MISKSTYGTPLMVSGKWHTLKIEVDVNKRVVAHFNGKRMGSFTAFFSTRGYGGALVANGRENDVQFKDFVLEPGE